MSDRFLAEKAFVRKLSGYYMHEASQKDKGQFTIQYTIETKTIPSRKAQDEF